MCYKKAKDILPTEIIGLIQQYVEGEFIYIPKKHGNRQCWGSKTNTRNEIEIRNSHIYNEYLKGTNKTTLSEKYFLSKKSIERIILKEKSR